MATGVNVFYNGVWLYNCLTLEFDQRPEYDPSHTDVVHHKFNVVVQAILNAEVLASSSPVLGAAPPGGSSSDRVAYLMTLIHRLLSQNRGQFIYTLDGNVLLQVDPCGSVSPIADANNGPRVTLIRIAHVTPVTLRIIFGVECALQVCTQQPGHPVLSNRWSSTDDYDEDYRTVRTWRGVLRVKQAVSNPHSFRGMVVPSLPKGWKRERMHFVGEANGLELGYEITDKQMVGCAPPAPATRMQCTHTEVMRGDAGMWSEADLNVRLDGPRGADKKELLQRCMQIAEVKLELATSDNGYVTELTCTDFIGPDENAVEVRARYRRSKLLEENDTGVLALKTFGKPLELPSVASLAYDKDIAVLQGAYGNSTLAGVFACYLQQPCNSQHNMPQNQPQVPKQEGDGKQEEPDTAQPVMTYTQGPPSQKFKRTVHNQDHRNAIYTFFRMESHFIRNENRVQLPIAATNSSSGDTSAVIRLAKATAKRTIKLAAERIGKWPSLWEPKDFEVAGFKHKLLNFHPNHRPPEATGDGKVLYAIDATYEYAITKAPGTTDPLPVGAVFWDSFAAPNNAFNSQHWIDPGGGDKALG